MSDRIEKWIDEALKSEPSFKIRSDFSDRIVKAIRKQEQRSARKLYFLMAIGMLGMFGIGYATLSYFLPSALSSFSRVGSVVPYAIILGILIAVIQYLDKKLVKDRLMLN